MANHKAAIHVLKSKLGMTDEDYRALLRTLTGETSTIDMTDAQQRQVRDHMQTLGERMGLVKATTQRRPKERKVWALWNQLYRDGRIGNPSAAALNAWVARQVDVSALRFATDPQLDTLIEALKAWQERS